ncbi:UNVERIFIED_CONTAM: hypothetical protein FKN15_016783, partial [Acipenser sinensis]
SFRITRATFSIIVELVKEDMQPKRNYIRPPVPVEKRVSIALYRLASSAEYRVVGNVFGVYKTTVHRCIYKFVNSLVHRHCNTYIAMPDVTEAKSIALQDRPASPERHLLARSCR